MAIPFTVDDDSDYEEALLQQLFADLWHTLQRIDNIQRSRRQSLSATRVRTTASAGTSRYHRDEPGDPSESERRLPPDSLVNLAVSLSPAGSQNDLDAILQPQNLSTPTRRRRRRRTRSEPSCCEETKPVRVSVSVEVTNKEWTPQQEKSAQSSTSDKRWCGGSEGLLSKLVPPPFSGPLWTAVICVVGWHLLRAR